MIRSRIGQFPKPPLKTFRSERLCLCLVGRSDRARYLLTWRCSNAERHTICLSSRPSFSCFEKAAIVSREPIAGWEPGTKV